eukprot:GHVR01110048.1.p1 GENE.GHVR01110048.1~~GHVR01110048.1.p1  ORF type:complete len:178 (+),score=30.61 GHVR01110048.1:167-700(+)
MNKTHSDPEEKDEMLLSDASINKKEKNYHSSALLGEEEAPSWKIIVVVLVALVVITGIAGTITLIALGQTEDTHAKLKTTNTKTFIDWSGGESGDVFEENALNTTTPIITNPITSNPISTIPTDLDEEDLVGRRMLQSLGDNWSHWGECTHNCYRYRHSKNPGVNNVSIDLLKLIFN